MCAPVWNVAPLGRNVVFFIGQSVIVPLFSYTSRLRSPFIFLRARSPGTFRLRDTMEPPLRRIICPAFSVSVWAFVPSSERPGGGATLPTAQGKPEPRCVVNRNLSGFPTGRKIFYKLSALFPTGRKPGVAALRYSTPGAPSHPAGGGRMGKLQSAARRFRRAAVPTPTSGLRA
jgi:hypothetical protein